MTTPKRRLAWAYCEFRDGDRLRPYCWAEWSGNKRGVCTHARLETSDYSNLKAARSAMIKYITPLIAGNVVHDIVWDEESYNRVRLEHEAAVEEKEAKVDPEETVVAQEEGGLCDDDEEYDDDEEELE